LGDNVGLLDGHGIPGVNALVNLNPFAVFAEQVAA